MHSNDSAILRDRLYQLSNDLNMVLCHGVPPRTRERYVAAIGLLAEFLRDVGFRARINVELLEFAKAIQELDQGIVQFFLEPAKRSSRPLEPSSTWLPRAYISVAIEVLRTEMSKRAACLHVAESFRSMASILAPQSKDFAATIGAWHTRHKGDRVRNQTAKSAWRDRAELIALSETRLSTPGQPQPTAVDIANDIVRSANVLATLSQPPLRGKSRSREERRIRAELGKASKIKPPS
jgi:hypothetical protein